ncbi:hypothetical protein OCGS_2395 [Oceaniovalibus guishaninsula JLT2003]|uniref:Endolytic murein transglycosylase n=1 Tax=Oceaniovalibus guishaninsula JLT2003 TaxID=1231392 RepID=K2H7S6_9RHOB|nr:endolytic transglycosylase MltG [Oceaniovalibus guishaninsula]EKE43663.1 hypothetical protein OCGS_2395 [Oceaniovalibus guishaninsula JLT2003]
MWRHVASNGLTLLIVALAVVGGAIAWGVRQFDTAGPLETAICVKVAPGSSMRRVSEDLEAQGAVSSGAIYRIGANYKEKSADLKAGSFLVPEGASMAEILDIITRGGQSTCGTEVVYRIGVNAREVQVRDFDPATGSYGEVTAFDPADEPPTEYRDVRDATDTRYRIALAEGVTSWQVVDALKAADFLTGEVEAVPPEGMLAPDSYEVRPGDERGELLNKMKALQEARLEAVWRNRAADLPIETPEDVLTLASIIEKETGIPDERGTVASVFVNRLNAGMRLQTDPTVIYGVTNGEGVLGRGLRRSELDRPTPYNTYVINGLPPGPIANPGLASLEAAVNPPETDLLYFVADGSGGHAFARTLDEHNANVARWRALEAQRAGQ